MQLVRIFFHIFQQCIFWKSVKIWRSYSEFKGGNFLLRHSVVPGWVMNWWYVSVCDNSRFSTSAGYQLVRLEIVYSVAFAVLFIACKDSYADGESEGACAFGCQGQLPAVETRRKHVIFTATKSHLPVCLSYTVSHCTDFIFGDTFSPLLVLLSLLAGILCETTPRIAIASPARHLVDCGEESCGRTSVVPNICRLAAVCRDCWATCKPVLQGLMVLIMFATKSADGRIQWHI